MADDLDIPEGFAPLALVDTGGFNGVNGPIYWAHEDGALVLGIRVLERHCNIAGWVHGGMLAYLADMLLIFSCKHEAGIADFVPTVSLNCDFIGAAKLGDWIEGRGSMIRATRSILFAQGLFTVGGAPVMRCSGVLKRPLPPAP